MTARAGSGMVAPGAGSSALQGRKGRTSGTGMDVAVTRILYKMIAAPAVGSTPVIWTVVGTADYEGTKATSAISPGTAVIDAILYLLGASRGLTPLGYLATTHPSRIHPHATT